MRRKPMMFTPLTAGAMGLVLLLPTPAWAAPEYEADNLTRGQIQEVEAALENASRPPQSRLRRQAIRRLERQSVVESKQGLAILEARDEGRKLSELVKDGVITRGQARTVRAAFREATNSADTAQWLAALGGLLAQGTITQTQADSIITNVSEGRVSQVNLGRVTPSRIT